MSIQIEWLLIGLVIIVSWMICLIAGVHHQSRKIRKRMETQAQADKLAEELTIVELGNIEQIAHDIYIVRTQAGFNQAYRRWRGYKKNAVDEDKKYDKIELKGFPRYYPSIVVFTSVYRGYHEHVARCIPIDKVKSLIDKHTVRKKHD